jgi:kynurenine formamidase
MDSQRAFEELIAAVSNLKMIDLSHTIEEGMPVYPTHPQYFHMRWHTGDPATLFQLLISEHAGTHLDVPLHFYSDPSDGRRLGLDEAPLGPCVGRAVKLEFHSIPPDAELGASDIRRWEGANLPLQKNDAAVFHFGWDRKWATLPAGRPFVASWPGISRDAAEYLAERGIRLAGTDCLGIDGSSTSDLGSHFVFLERGIYIVENLENLEKVPTIFFLITLPLKIRDGGGSPIRAVGLVPKDS